LAEVLLAVAVQALVAADDGAFSTRDVLNVASQRATALRAGTNRLRDVPQGRGYVLEEEEEEEEEVVMPRGKR